MGSNLSCAGWRQKKGSKGNGNVCSLPKSSLKINDSYYLTQLIPPKFSSVGFGGHIVKRELVHPKPNCVHGMWTSREQPSVILLAVGPPSRGVLRLDIGGEQPNIHQVVTGDASLEQIAVMQVDESRLVLLEWTPSPPPTTPNVPPRIIARCVRVSMWAVGPDTGADSEATECTRVEFDDDTARAVAFLHKLSDTHMIVALRNSINVRFLALSNAKMELFDTVEWPHSLRSVAFTRDDSGRNLAAACFNNDEDFTNNILHLYSINVTGFKQMILLSKLTMECPVELIWLNKYTLAAWCNLEQYNSFSLHVVSRGEGNRIETKENGVVESGLKLTLWASPQYEELFVYDGEANNMTTWQII